MRSLFATGDSLERAPRVLTRALFWLAPATLLIALVPALALPPAALAATTDLVSRDNAGVPAASCYTTAAPNGVIDSLDPAISANGRYVAFTSAGANLFPGGINPLCLEAVFVRDRLLGTTQLASVDPGGFLVGDVGAPAISADGRLVAFAARDGAGVVQVYLRDLDAGTTELVSVSSTGVAGDKISRRPALSADGERVAFASEADNLVDGDTNQREDVFVRNRAVGTTVRVSVASDGAQGGRPSDSPAVSPDGNRVGFASWANNLVRGDTNESKDVFVHDLSSGVTQRVSVGTAGAEGNDSSFSPALSSDGRCVAFDSAASNLVAGDTNHSNDIFVRDTVAGSTERVSLSGDGTQGDVPLDAQCGGPAISGDGSNVAFASHSDNLVSDDTNGTNDIFVRDRSGGTTRRVSVSNAGAQADGDSGLYGEVSVAISGDGSNVAFSSIAQNLVVDSPAAGVYTRDLAAGDPGPGTSELSGTLEEASSSVPVGGATVCVPGGASAITAADGTWSIDHVDSSVRTVLFHQYAGLASATAVRSVSLAPGSLVTVDATLTSQSGNVVGTVSAAGGGALPGAYVSRLMQDSVGGQTWAGTVVAGSEGRYALPNVRAGTRHLLVSMPGYVSQSVTVTVPSCTTTTFDVQLTASPPASPQSGTLAGRVTDRNRSSAGVAGVHIIVPGGPCAISVADGSYALAGISPGFTHVVATLPNWPTTQFGALISPSAITTCNLSFWPESGSSVVRGSDGTTHTVTTVNQTLWDIVVTTPDRADEYVTDGGPGTLTWDNGPTMLATAVLPPSALGWGTPTFNIPGIAGVFGWLDPWSEYRGGRSGTGASDSDIPVDYVETPGPTVTNTTIIDFNIDEAATLTAGSVSPASGSVATTYTYQATWADYADAFPTTANVVIDGLAHAMTYVTGPCSLGATYSYATTLSPDTHSYHFEFEYHFDPLVFSFEDDPNWNTFYVRAAFPTVGDASGPTVASDTSPPETTLYSDPPPNAAGWNDSTVTVTLNATDGPDGLGVAGTYCVLDSVPGLYTAPFQVSAEGTHTLSYWSVDTSGNVEASKTATIQIDRTGPSLRSERYGQQTPANSFYAPGTVLVTAWDTTSGVPALEYDLDNTGWRSGNVQTGVMAEAEVTTDTVGWHTVDVRATDLAGNLSTGTTTFNVLPDPALFLHADPVPNPAGWSKSTVAVSLEATPFVTNTSPGQASFYVYGLDSGGSIGSTFTVSDEGEHTVDWAFVQMNSWVYSPTLEPLTGYTTGYSTVFDTVIWDSPVTTTIKIDETSPTVSLSSPNYTLNTWASHDVTFTLSGADPLPGGVNENSGVKACYYRTRPDGGTWSADTTAEPAGAGPSNAVTISAEGMTTVEYWSVDNAGNVSNRGSATVDIDKTGPNLQSTNQGTYRGAAWPMNLDIEAYDDVSGVSSLQYDFDNTGWVSGWYANHDYYWGDVQTGVLGTHNVQIRATDVAGNISTGTVVFTITPPPTLTLRSGPASNSAGWNHSDVSVSLEATPFVSATNPSADSRYEYSLDSGQTGSYGSTFTVSHEGTTPVDWDFAWVIDEKFHSVTGLTPDLPYSLLDIPVYRGPSTTIKIDETSPTVSLTSPNYMLNTWASHDVTFTLLGTDPLPSGVNANSGVKACYYRTRLNNGPWSADTTAGPPGAGPSDPVTVSDEGTTTVEYWSVDNADNVSARQTATIKIDKTPPTLSLDATAAYTTSATVSAVASDALSGLDHIDIKLDVGPWTTSTHVSISALGSHTVYARAFDLAGNERDTQASFTVNAPPPPPDTTPPTTTLHAVPASNTAGWDNASMTVTLDATDNAGGSGVAATYYTLDSESRQTYGGAFPFSTEGTHAVHYWSVDNATNSEATKTATLKVDTTLPSLSLDATASYASSATIYALGSDAISGLDRIEMKLDGGSWATVSQVTTSALGSHTVYARAFDVAGNERDVSATFAINAPPPTDTIPPTTTLLALPASNTAGWNNTSVAMSLSATDNPGGSGVSGTWCSIDLVPYAYTTTITVGIDGTHTIKYWSTDKAGNAEATKTATIRVDKTLPLLSLDASASYTSAATIHASASDACSGLGHVEMKLDTSAWATGTSVSTSVVGTHTVYARAFDLAGNERDVSATFTVNAAPPPIGVTVHTCTRLCGPCSAGLNKQLTLTGSVCPAAAPGSVTIVMSRLSGCSWVSAGSATVPLSKGCFTCSCKPTVRGSWRFVATYSGGHVGTTTYTPSTSAVVCVTVK